MAKEGNGYTPPIATTRFYTDVDVGDTGVLDDGDFAADWIMEIDDRWITMGCAGFIFCPSAVMTQADFARWLARTFGFAS